MGESQKHARKLAGRLVLPDPWNVDDLCADISKQRDRPIQVLAWEKLGDSVTATVLSTATADYIFWRADLAGIHREHAICHELGHLLAGHTQQSELSVNLSISAATVEMMTLNRDCDYGQDRERTAETIADVIMQRVSQRIASPHANPDGHQARRIINGYGDALR